MQYISLVIPLKMVSSYCVLSDGESLGVAAGQDLACCQKLYVIGWEQGKLESTYY